MTIYFAGGSHYEFLHNKPILESFWYKKNALKAMSITKEFFLDSGAFSAFTSNAEIDVEQYAEFIIENKAKIKVASSLDSIGDAAKSYELYIELTKKLDCPNVIPVFHCREDISWLQKYIALDIPYIALGGMVPESTKWLYHWLNDLWANYLTDKKGISLLKVHGFGLTVGGLIERYPWFSVDSTTWLNGARFGTAIFNFPGRRLVHIAISDRNPEAKKFTGSHIDRLPKNEKILAMKQLNNCGIDLQTLRSDTNTLLYFNTWSFNQWEKKYGFAKAFKNAVQQGLF